MLEADGVLRTWRLSEPPKPEHPVEAESIGDHRLMYLDYEGEVSGGRGQVRRYDYGTFSWIQYDSNQVQISISGSQTIGRITITDRELSLWVE